MKRMLNIKSVMLAGLVLVISASTIYLIAADHIDAPAVEGTTSDITDYYAFESPSSSSNMVFVVNTQGLLAPASTGSAAFDEEVMIEINIDNSSTKDQIEDLVIQATFMDGKVQVYGPVAPSMTGTTSVLMEDDMMVEASITAYGDDPTVATDNSVKVFAGPRDDPFFFDFDKFEDILAGDASSFSDTGTDTFAGTNVLSLVIELPKTMLGSASTIDTWVTSNRLK